MTSYIGIYSSALRHALFILFLVVPCRYASAQNSGGLTPANAPGAPAGSYSLSNLETINYYNGNLNFALPLLQAGGRGATQVPVVLPIETHWHVVPIREPNGYTHYEANSNWDDTDAISMPLLHYGAGGLQARYNYEGEKTVVCFEPRPPEQSLTTLVFTTPDGTKYELHDQYTGGRWKPWPGCNLAQGAYRGRVFVTTDGTSVTYLADADVYDADTQTPTTGYLMMRDGTRYRIELGLIRWMRDRNGNRTTFTYDTSGVDGGRLIKITDSLNREVSIQYDVADDEPYGLCDHITYKGFGGAPRTIRVSFKHLGSVLKDGHSLKARHQLFPHVYSDSDPNVPGPVLYDPVVVSAVWLPDGVRSYKFRYNRYSELARVDLPTGGAFEYDFAPGVTNWIEEGVLNGPQNNIYRRVATRRVYREGNVLEGVTAIGRPESSSTAYPMLTVQNLGYVQVDQCDADLNPLTSERHYFYGTPSTTIYGYYGAPWTNGKEYKTEFFAPGDPNPLRRTEYTWQQTPIYWWQGSPDQAPINNPHITETISTLGDTNQVTKVSHVKDGIVGFDQYNNITDTWEYDYGTGAPSAYPVRHTHTDYVTTNEANGTDYTGTNIYLRSLPQEVRTYQVDPVTGIEASTPASKTHFYYDQGTLTDRSGISGHDPAFTTGYVTRGNVTRVSRWLKLGTGEIWINADTRYDIAGNVVSVTDPRNNQTTFDYTDRFGAPNGEARANTAPTELGVQASYAFATAVTNALGHTAYGQVDYYSGQPVDAEDANGIVTSGYYNDLLDRTTQVVRAVSTNIQSQTTFNYDDNNRTITTTSDLNAYNDNILKSQVLYDGLGRTVETRRYETGTTYIANKQTYDALGRVSQASNPYRPLAQPAEVPVWTTTGYDALGRVISVTTPDGAVARTAFNGAQVLATDQAGKQRMSQTDALGRLTDVWEIKPADGDTVAITFPQHPEVVAGYRTGYKYDVLGNLRQVTQGGQQRYFAYDTLSRLIRVKLPEQGSFTANADFASLTDGVTNNAAWSEGYLYDEAGNLSKRINARNIITTYTPDALNRIQSRTYSDGTTPAVQYVYEDSNVPRSKGRLTSVITAGVSTTSYGNFDALGRVKQSSQTIGSVTYNFSDYSYDLAGNLTSETYPSGRVVVTEHDSAGGIAGVKNQATGNYYAGAAATDPNRIQYTAHGAVSALRLGNGLWEHAAFNSRLQPYQLGLGSSSTDSGKLQLDYTYGVLVNNQLDQTRNNGNVQSQTITAPGLPAAIVQSYTYDSLNRLSGAQEAGANGWTQNFSYDRYGNRNFAAGTNAPALPSGIYDPVVNPQISQSTNRLDNTAAGQGNILYNPAGDMTRDVGGHTYGYDAEGRLSQYDGGAAVNGGATYIYDGAGQRVQKSVGSSVTVFVYDAAGRLAAEYGGALPTTNGTSYITTDPLGTPRVVTSANGAVVARHDYRPFGDEINPATNGRANSPGYSGADGLRQKFTGYERDSETGLDYAQARYYASAHGRFTSVDPLLASGRSTSPQTWNRYSYGLNNPLRYTDPSGLETSGYQTGDMRGPGVGNPQDSEEERRQRQQQQLPPPSPILIPTELPPLPPPSGLPPAAALPVVLTGLDPLPDPTHEAVRAEAVQAATEMLQDNTACRAILFPGVNPIERMNTYMENNLITVAPTFTNADGSRGTFGAGTGAVTSVGAGVIVRPGRVNQSASRITINSSGFFMNGNVNGVAVNTMRGAGFEGNSLREIRGLAMIHEDAHAFGRLPSDAGNPGQSRANSSLIKALCAPQRPIPITTTLSR